MNVHVEKLCNLAIKLDWTNPTITFDNGRWPNQELIAATNTNAWHIAYELFSSPWKNCDDLFPGKKSDQITGFFSTTKASNPNTTITTSTCTNTNKPSKTTTNKSTPFPKSNQTTKEKTQGKNINISGRKKPQAKTTPSPRTNNGTRLTSL